MSTYPGKQSLSFDAAKALVKGSTYVQTDSETIDISTSSDRSDRLLAVAATIAAVSTVAAVSSTIAAVSTVAALLAVTAATIAAVSTLAAFTAATVADVDDVELHLPSPEELHEGPVCFRHDPRLMHPSFVYLNNQQVKSFIDAIDTKVG